MADPFISEIRAFSFGFAPQGWARCDGQLMPLVQNTVLFSLIGTTYGGDGKSTFALPDLRGRVPVMFGQGSGTSEYAEGDAGGEEAVTLLTAEMPGHAHALSVSPQPATTTQPASQNFAAGKGVGYWSTQPPAGSLDPGALTLAGGNAPHDNLQPYLTTNFCIALRGVFPPRGEEEEEGSG